MMAFLKWTFVYFFAATFMGVQAQPVIFSGADLTLRGNGFSNVYGDVYTQGNLTFAARDGGQAAVFSNLSGTVEAEGNIGINIGVAAPMAFFPFSGWHQSFFGDLHPSFAGNVVKAMGGAMRVTRIHSATWRRHLNCQRVSA